MRFRQYRKDDAGALAKIFFDAVRNGPSPYTEAQRLAWVPQAPEPDVFDRRLASMFVTIAEVQGNPVGFIAMASQGYIDLAFVLHDYRGQDAFRHLYENIEMHARKERLIRLWTHASLMAQPAFLALGFCVMHHEAAERNGQLLARAAMEKWLTD